MSTTLGAALRQVQDHLVGDLSAKAEANVIAAEDAKEVMNTTLQDQIEEGEKTFDADFSEKSKIQDEKKKEIDEFKEEQVSEIIGQAGAIAGLVDTMQEAATLTEEKEEDVKEVRDELTTKLKADVAALSTDAGNTTDIDPIDEVETPTITIGGAS
jgi:sugar-specific transcriptional regulator TrmB